MKVRDYIEFKTGNTNIILSAPHAGNVKPKDIPRRKYGKVLMDTHTRQMTNYILNYFTQKPYYIMAKIHRSRVDFNRALEEATQGNKDAIHMWKTWHNVVKYYLSLVKNPLYVELHSHNDSDEFQLGYDISKKDYIRIQHETGLEHDKMFGPYSIKAFLERAGYNVYAPTEGVVYFNGGYGVETYKGRATAVQIEVPVEIAKHNRARVSRDIGAALFLFKSKFVDI